MRGRTCNVLFLCTGNSARSILAGKEGTGTYLSPYRQDNLSIAAPLKDRDRYVPVPISPGNSARSILAEALLNRDGAGRFRAFSAGSSPKGAVHLMALAILREHGVPTDGLRSKSWDEFAGPDAARIDFIITVCDHAAGEICPIWPGRPMTAHWGIEDPASVEGPGQRQAFATARRRLESRIAAFLSLPIDTAGAADVQSRLREIGRMEDAGLA